MESSFDYLRAHAAELGSRILETYPPLQSTKDPIAPAVASLLRKALPAQGLAITGTAKYLRQAKAARIVAECGAGKTYMALGTIHVLADGQPSTTLVMCPSHITHKWAREVLLTIPRARAFLIEDMRNGGEGLGEKPFHGRVVLLVNRHTASAAEMIVAFARENQLATIVGEKMAGRLLSATSVKVGNGFRLAMPTGAYYTWNGLVLEGTPMEPDELIEFNWRERRERVDGQLEHAVKSIRGHHAERVS